MEIKNLHHVPVYLRHAVEYHFESDFIHYFEEIRITSIRKNTVKWGYRSSYDVLRIDYVIEKDAPYGEDNSFAAGTVGHAVFSWPYQDDPRHVDLIDWGCEGFYEYQQMRPNHWNDHYRSWLWLYVNGEDSEW